MLPLVAAWFTLSLAACAPREPAPGTAPASGRVAELLTGGDAAGYLRAESPPRLQFPRDHGSHPGYRTEWWYFTGNVADATGRRFGYQLTVFRQALVPPAAADGGGVASVAADPQAAPLQSGPRATVAQGASAATADGAADGSIAEPAHALVIAAKQAGAPDALAAPAPRVVTDLPGDDAEPTVPQAGDASAAPSTANPGAPAAAAATSPWRARDAYLAHLAITDVVAGTHDEATRLARGALGQAGVVDEPLDVWVEDFRITAAPVAPATPWTLSLRAADAAGGIGIALELRALRPPLLHGEDGLSRKGPDAASHYYSITRLATTGTLTAGGRSHEVRGLSWLDREWSTSALAPEQVGWDWLSLQLDDGRDLMLYRMRRRDGSADPFDSGTLLDAAGNVTRLRAGDFSLDPRDWFTDEHGSRWPTLLSVRVLDETFTVRAVLADQLLRGDLGYWEGAVRVDGSHGGRGYLELTGY
jgi:predicted secreted hydrolase